MAKDSFIPQPSPVEWIVVYVTYNLPEAHIVAGRLQNEGVPAMVNSALGAGALGIIFGSLGEVRVLVHPSQYGLALSILDEDLTNALPDDVDRIIFDSQDDEPLLGGDYYEDDADGE
ncbi:MAG: DUF2007 domain-containing protein [Burkholderiales bacterium]|nr:DUF2007 domain-containing protein [Anaerolineae bacterium]